MFALYKEADLKKQFKGVNLIELSPSVRVPWFSVHASAYLASTLSKWIVKLARCYKTSFLRRRWNRKTRVFVFDEFLRRRACL